MVARYLHSFSISSSGALHNSPLLAFAIESPKEEGILPQEEIVIMPLDCANRILDAQKQGLSILNPLLSKELPESVVLLTDQTGTERVFFELKMSDEQDNFILVTPNSFEALKNIIRFDYIKDLCLALVAATITQEMFKQGPEEPRNE